MGYVRPQEVKYDRIAELKVIHDGGLYDPSNPDWSGWSLAEALWDGVPVTLIRWNNSSSDAERGYPVDRHGLPTWLVLPRPAASIYVAAIRMVPVKARKGAAPTVAAAI